MKFDLQVRVGSILEEWNSTNGCRLNSELGWENQVWCLHMTACRLWLGLQFDSMRLIFLISNRVCIAACRIGCNSQHIRLCANCPGNGGCASQNTLKNINIHVQVPLIMLFAGWPRIQDAFCIAPCFLLMWAQTWVLMKEDMLSLFVTAFMLSLVCSRIEECTFSVFVVKVPFLFCFRRIIMEIKLLVHYLSLHCFFIHIVERIFVSAHFFLVMQLSITFSY